MNFLFFLSTASHNESFPQAAEHATQETGQLSTHLVNWVSLLAHALGDESPLAGWMLKNEMIIFTGVIISLITLFFIHFSHHTQIIPGKVQLVVEELVVSLDKIICGVLGSDGRRYTPFVGSVFIYVLINNLFGLIPLMNSSTADIKTTAAIAICVFFYVQWIGITRNGLGKYFHHLAGSPRDIMGYAMIPLMLPLHIMGEFAKPVSLMFRLYGNVMAGHLLIAVFLGLGLAMVSRLHIPIGIPLHFPFLFLEILVGVIQAFVFTILTTVYINMMLPHGAEEHA